MKVTFDRSKLARALMIAARQSSVSTYIPTRFVFIETMGPSTAFLTCTNFSMSVQVRVEGEVERPGIICVSVKTLKDLVRLAQSPKITLDCNLEWDASGYSNLQVSSGEIVFTIKAVDPFQKDSPFPKIEGHVFQLPAKEMLDAIKTVLFACSTDEARPSLMGVKIMDEAVAATDGYRIAMMKGEFPVNGIVPAKFLKEAVKYLHPENAYCWTNGEKFALTDGDATYETVLVSGSFPDYSKVIPKTYKMTVLGPAKKIRSMLAVSSVLVGSSHDYIYARITQSAEDQKYRMRLESKGEWGVTCTELECEVTSSDIPFPYEIAFQRRFLLEALDFSGEFFRFEFNANNTPLRVQPKEANGWQCVLMPCHIG